MGNKTLTFTSTVFKAVTFFFCFQYYPGIFGNFVSQFEVHFKVEHLLKTLQFIICG